MYFGIDPDVVWLAHGLLRRPLEYYSQERFVNDRGFDIDHLFKQV